MLTRLRDYGINYSDSYIWRPNACPRPILTYIRHLKHFHESPIVKYAYNSISYLLFLAIFCYYLLFNFEMLTDDKPAIHWTEIVVIIMVSIMLIEEIRQVDRIHRLISSFHTLFSSFLVHQSRESIDHRETVELFHPECFLQLDPCDIVYSLLRGPHPTLYQI